MNDEFPVHYSWRIFIILFLLIESKSFLYGMEEDGLMSAHGHMVIWNTLLFLLTWVKNLDLEWMHFLCIFA